MRIARARYVGVIAPLAGLIAAVACKKTPPEAHSAPAVAHAAAAAADPAAGGGKAADKPLDTVPPPGIDISKLDEFERKVFFRVVNKEPSACGDPKSLL